MNIDKLDRIFSTFIRLRDRIPGTQQIKCISCGKYVNWEQSDCGHYVNRKHKSTRWDEKNCSAQCRSCNRYDEGNIPGYTLGIQKKYGKDIVELLLHKKQQTSHFDQFEIDQLTNHYKKCVKELKSR